MSFDALTIATRNQSIFIFLQIQTEGVSCPKLLLPKTYMNSEFIWIYLKSQRKFWNLKIWFKSEKKIILLEIYFKCGLRRVVQCVRIWPYHVINLNTHTRYHSVGSMFEPEWKIFRLKWNLGFQINSNGFSGVRSFGLLSWKSFWINLKSQIKFWYLKI